MRKSFLILLMLFSLSAYAQDWKNNLPQLDAGEELTLLDYQTAFNKYWDSFDVKDGYYLDVNGQRQKAAGWKIFKRWEYHWESRVNQTSGAFPKTSANDEYNNWKKRQPRINTRSVDGDWVSLGPSTSDGGYAGIGRLNCVAFHPDNNDVYWVGSPSGGIWKTGDDGSTWTVLSDDNEVLGVSDIAVSSDFGNDQTLYIATGDRNGGSMWSLGGGQNNDNNSIGVLKSTDDGASWNTTGLTYAVSQRRRINRLLIDPNNDDRLYAATSIGVYKTEDAGVTWTKLNNNHFNDLEFKPGTSTTLYASDRNGDIYRSTNSGTSFQKVLDTDHGRVEIAVTEDNSSIVYAVMNGSNKLGGVYKSTNGGGSFSKVYNGNLNLLGYNCNGLDVNSQGNYDLCIAADPNDANTLFVGGSNNWKSTDGGVNWSINTHWSGTCGGDAEEVHADKHFLAFQNGNSTLFECNDGGIYKTTNGGTNWTDKSNGLFISQLYRIGVSQSQSNATVIGLQDNGTKLLHTDDDWHDVLGGDGMECIIDYDDYNIQYRCYVRGEISRTTNVWNNTKITKSGGNWINGIDASESGSWVTPYSIDLNNHNTLFLGLEDVWKSTNKGNSWSKISTMNTGQNLRSLAVAASDSDTMYVADPNQLWVTTDGGSNWTERTAGLPVGANSITYIAIKNEDAKTLWVTFGGYNGNRIYESTDMGQNWTNISSGLPNLPVMTVVYNKQNDMETELYVGTDVGVYIKIGMDNWKEYSTGMPNVVVNELEIYYDNNLNDSRLRAGTSGRGLWESDLNTASTGPMVFQSSTTTQNNTDIVSKGSIDQEIIGIEMAIQGNQNPLSLTSFYFKTSGTTDASGDLMNAKVYFTGTSNSFAATNEFGDLSGPNGDFVITGNQSLAQGTNYFWLTYDIENAAQNGNVIDAQCDSMIITGMTKMPSLIAPTGNREISCEYCESYGNDDFETSTTLVEFNTINNTSAKPILPNGRAYSDYTNISTDLALGQTYDLTIKVNTDGPYEAVTKVWIDWNSDCDFDDANEEYDLGLAGNVSNGPTSNSPLLIDVPDDLDLDSIRMRVSTKYTNPGAGQYATNCQEDFDGEVEDYTIVLVHGNVTWLGVNTNWHDAQNWSNGVIPTYSHDVTIPSIPQNGEFPTIQAGSTANCYGLTLEPNAILNVLGKLEAKTQ